MRKENLFKKCITLCILFLIVFSAQTMLCRAETTLKAPNPVRVWRKSNTSLRLRWKRVKNADGYIIYKYSKAKDKYINYKTIKNRNTVIFNDKVGSHTSAKYRVSAYRQVGKKKVIGKRSYYVCAITYKKGDQKVNVGKVEIKVPWESYYYDGYSVNMGYYETLKLSVRVNPSNYSNHFRKKVLSKKVRWFSSNPKIATVDKNGKVKAKGKVGTCNIYSRAHNGKRSSQITVNVINAAKPNEDHLRLNAAWEDRELYGIVLEMFVNQYKTVTDIAEYFYINRPKKGEEFVCYMRDGEVIMDPENYVSGAMKQKIYNFIKDFPYDIFINAKFRSVEFMEQYKSSIYDEYSGTIVRFHYNHNEKEYFGGIFTEYHHLAPNWFYGYFAAL